MRIKGPHAPPWPSLHKHPTKFRLPYHQPDAAPRLHAQPSERPHSAMIKDPSPIDTSNRAASHQRTRRVSPVGAYLPLPPTRKIERRAPYQPGGEIVGGPTTRDFGRDRHQANIASCYDPTPATNCTGDDAYTRPRRGAHAARSGFPFSVPPRRTAVSRSPHLVSPSSISVDPTLTRRRDGRERGGTDHLPTQLLSSL